MKICDHRKHDVTKINAEGNPKCVDTHGARSKKP